MLFISNKNSKYLNWFIGFIVLYFLSQSLFKFLQFYKYDFYRTTTIINFLFEILLLIVFVNIKKKEFLLPIIILLTSFFLGQWLLKSSTFNISGNDSFIKEFTNGHLLQLNNYLLIFFFWEVFKKIKNLQVFSYKVLKILSFIFLVNSFFVLIAFVFDVEILRSYPNTQRFGSLGFLNAHTFAMYFYFIIITYYYKQYLIVSKNITKFKLLYSVFIALILGKKAVLLFLFLLTLYHAYYILKVSWKILSLCLIALFSICIVFKNQILNVLFEIFPFWIDIYNERGMLSFLTSLRSEKLEIVADKILYNWTTLNYLIGGPVIPEYRVEYGIADIYVFFGFLGLIIYFFLFRNILKNIKIKDKVLLLLVLFVSFCVGGFLVNINLMMFYICLIVLFYNNGEAFFTKTEIAIKN